MNSLNPTLKSLLDALAFANVDNLGEFRAMLERSQRPAPADTAATDATPATRGNPALAPALGHIQGAL